MKYEVQSETKHHLMIDFAGNDIRLPIDEDQKNIHQDNVVDLVIDLLVEYFQEVRIFEHPDDIIFYSYGFSRDSYLLARAKIPWKNEYSKIHKGFQIDMTRNTDNKEIIRKIVKYFCYLN